MYKKEYSIEIGGKNLIAEFSDLAMQANGSVTIRYGNSVVLATAVMGATDREGVDFFPLVVDYEEKFYASGQILGSRFARREGKPSEEAILRGRIIDRTIRPLFDSHIRREVQVVITTLSVDENDPDILAVIAASLALGVSDIPWNGPVSAVRIGKIKNGLSEKQEPEFEINPNYAYRNHVDFELDMVTCGKDDLINMIEVGAREVVDDLVVAGFKKANQEIGKLQEFQKKIIAELGKEKVVIERVELSDAARRRFEEEYEPQLDAAVFSGKAGKELIDNLKKEWLKTCAADFADETALALEWFEDQVSIVLHREAIEKGRRADGRSLDEIRPLFAQAGQVSPILHGSGIFYRGETHVFSALTLGGPQDAQIIDGVTAQEAKRFMHHYNFPPFSTGETGRLGGTNRRMIGHGALAEKALVPVIPSQDSFPYTIRLVSETMSSNGSSSMASVCASTLALMDGGVPITRPVAGIASGLMMNQEKTGIRYALLTDIQGPEDHHGDMDFKVAGTVKGITAIQMDVKINGIPISILAEALQKAREARLKILDVMQKTINEPRPDISPRAPKILSLSIAVDQIGMVIGPSGKMIKSIKEKTGAEIDIEDDGTVFITGRDGAAEAAKEFIESLTKEYKKGERFTGIVTRLMDFGAFVRIGPTAEGLVHVSEIASFRVDKVADVLKIGEEVPVIIKEIDEKKRINLSIKQADPNFIKKLETTQ